MQFLPLLVTELRLLLIDAAADRQLVRYEDPGLRRVLADAFRGGTDSAVALFPEPFGHRFGEYVAETPRASDADSVC